ncbi:cell division control 14, SIN component [Aulographum hederae CBS 113979]|uniref:Cell division control 14, SIN component n=1 Tax=Aulographum hederae CBS 113979 TaxID=1176131 RepID=A0A6G1GKB5_9PEZI|nr:cell division control 14, SIN component [Aulographum hederae CBS 113979]
MESLLSVAFDNISSRSTQKIRKGFRQIEGLLAQICLSNAPSQPKRRASALPSAQPPPLKDKQLTDLSHDPAFREFFRLQEGFEWNIATRLVSCLERILGMGSSGQNDLLILSALSLLQGILLLHPPSRTLFQREIYMNLLLDLLSPDPNPPAIQSLTLHVLVTSLLTHPANTRTFESIDGLLTVTSLFKSRETTRDVKMKVVEFLYFYLMEERVPAFLLEPETFPREEEMMGTMRLLGGSGNGNGKENTQPKTAFRVSGNEKDKPPPSKHNNVQDVFDERRRQSTASAATLVDPDTTTTETDADDDQEIDMTRTTEEKMRLLGRFLGNAEVADLVADLRESLPFGEVPGAGDGRRKG